MQTRYFALIFGIAYILAAAAGVIPGLLVRSPDLPPLSVDALYGRALGLFPVNVLHTLVHLVIGLWGVTAWRAFASAQLYARALAIIYGVLTILGAIPATQTLFGYVPLFGHDIWLHAITAIVAACFGWFAEARAVGDTTHSDTAAHLPRQGRNQPVATVPRATDRRAGQRVSLRCGGRVRGCSQVRN